jgi:hypothetical protein
MSRHEHRFRFELAYFLRWTLPSKAPRDPQDRRAANRPQHVLPCLHITAMVFPCGDLARLSAPTTICSWRQLFLEGYVVRLPSRLLACGRPWGQDALNKTGRRLRLPQSVITRLG